jgi:alkylation response protein AidB-like acyl-CoA dehydrogenase
MGESQRELVLERAHNLVPLLQKSADQAETKRAVPKETIDALRKSGLIRITQPKRFGGAELGWDVLCEVAQILASADGAQAWVGAIMADHAQMLACFPEAAQEDVWNKNSDAVMSASFEPTGHAIPVAGGFQFSGEHSFASGIDHADWLICGGFIIEGGKQKGPNFFLVPSSDVEIIDDWHSVGLQGTGSKSFRVSDVFIPAHRRLDGAEARAGMPPGALVNTAAVYRISRGIHTSCLFSALSVGMAQGLFQEWLSYTAQRVSHGVVVRERPEEKMIAGECSAKIAAAEALYLKTIREAMGVLESGGKQDAHEQILVKRNAAYAAKLALEAGTRLFNAAGGRVIFQGAALQRRYRDLLASASHFSITWDGSSLNSGESLLNLAVN